MFKTSLQPPLSSVPKVAVVEKFNCATLIINNRPLTSFKNPHFQNEAKSTTFLVKMSFLCMRMKNHFHEGWALNLVLARGNSEMAYSALTMYDHHIGCCNNERFLSPKCDNFSGALSSKYGLEDLKKLWFLRNLRIINYAFFTSFVRKLKIIKQSPRNEYNFQPACGWESLLQAFRLSRHR